MSGKPNQLADGQGGETVRVSARPPFWLLAFSYLLMGPALGINCAFLAFAVPAMAGFGLRGLTVAFAIGMVLGMPAAFLLAQKIHQGISEGS